MPYNSVPVVYRNVVLVGANNPPGSGGAPGNARAFDARNGAKLWELSSVAQPGSPGHDTWTARAGRGASERMPGRSISRSTSNAGLVPAARIADPWGLRRRSGRGQLYGNSLVAVDVQTGGYRWHFQTIHHDLWDADPPAPPGLLDIIRGGCRFLPWQ